MPIFLYSYSKRQLHGVWVAASDGELDINPNGEDTSLWSKIEVQFLWPQVAMILGLVKCRGALFTLKGGSG
jgi:Development and cell death domain